MNLFNVNPIQFAYLGHFVFVAVWVRHALLLKQLTCLKYISIGHCFVLGTVLFWALFYVLSDHVLCPNHACVLTMLAAENCPGCGKRKRGRVPCWNRGRPSTGRAWGTSSRWKPPENGGKRRKCTRRNNTRKPTPNICGWWRWTEKTR